MQFAQRLSDGAIVVDRRLPARFSVHGLLASTTQPKEIRFTVAVFTPNEPILAGPIYVAALAFVRPYGGALDHGPYNGPPHVFSVVIPTTGLKQDPFTSFGWVGQCLYKALLTAAEPVLLEHKRREE